METFNIIKDNNTLELEERKGYYTSVIARSLLVLSDDNHPQGDFNQIADFKTGLILAEFNGYEEIHQSIKKVQRLFVETDFFNDIAKLERKLGGLSNENEEYYFEKWKLEDVLTDVEVDISVAKDAINEVIEKIKLVKDSKEFIKAKKIYESLSELDFS